ncbi:D-alanyl-D-alanine carboxypeptidase family protein [Chamaesiphon sp. OTE_20_metabat_361]|uniref:M15 family metallopeptidase n=1 Tax=Chamaesiphon sp. OTE_20_metabat_361 TaxID=2964689 RepID=UPI00286B6A39|nr:D-alanyl-D-alanine carboxypeptidase family protein [Chamaesiphon sp. OTE_20_metabat_361]
MSNPDRSKPGKAEDIPAALRDGTKPRATKPDPVVTPRRLPIGAIVGVAILLAGGAAVMLRLVYPPAPPTPRITTTNPRDPQGSSATTDNLLNHLPYTEAPDAELVSIGSGYRLRKNAAVKFQAMVAAARASGVNITTISAFRSVEDQKRLFFGVGAARGQQPSKRAEVSAPPTYSEHHTGYAVDVGDGTVPATNLNQNFDTTPAYKWLKTHAATYSFELSFPKDNIQKVSYEPWHWRFVGDINSLETFYKAHNLKAK